MRSALELHWCSDIYYILDFKSKRINLCLKEYELHRLLATNLGHVYSR